MDHVPGTEHGRHEGDPLVGARLLKYEVKRCIGLGGMGRVYEAWNPIIGKRVAIKVLDGLVDEAGVERFLREARAASAIESPHIVQVFDTGETADGRPFIVMELLRGEPLSDRIIDGPMEATEVVRIATQILRGLSRAHDAGIVHRDLKPENIFLVDATPAPPIVKILDFGIVKWTDPGAAPDTLTREGDVLGTPAYMSPEQARGDRDLDARTDLWSLGAIMYECLTGRSPFAGALSYEQTVVRICSSEPVAIETLAPDCEPRVVDAVMRCLRKERDERPKSARELDTALNGLSVTERAPRSSAPRARDATTRGPVPPPAPRRAKHVAAAFASVLALLSLAAAAGPRWSSSTVVIGSSAANAPSIEVESTVTQATVAEPPVPKSTAAAPDPPASAMAPSTAPSLQTATRSIVASKVRPVSESSAERAPAPPSAARRGVAGSLVIQTQ